MSGEASAPLVLWLDGEAATRRDLAGGKGAALAELVRLAFDVPEGFVVTTSAFRAFFDGALRREVTAMLASMGAGEAEMARTAAAIAERFRQAPLPSNVVQALGAAHERLCRGQTLPLAVRSSATAEDMAEASFAGQQETFLGVVGVEAFLDRVRACWASLFTPRAIFYRQRRGIGHDVAMAVVCQRLLRAEKSGVLFTVDPVQGRRHVAIVEAVRGLGEGLVSGAVTPDHYQVEKTTGKVLFQRLARRRPSPAHAASAWASSPLAGDDLGPVLSLEELQRLVTVGCRLEAHFGRPQDVEWAVEGGRLYLLQSRPVTTM